LAIQSSPVSMLEYISIPLGAIFIFSFFFYNDPSTTEIYTLSLHDALPIWRFEQRAQGVHGGSVKRRAALFLFRQGSMACERRARSEEHTSELQSRENLVCRLLLEKKKNAAYNHCIARGKVFVM